MGEWPDDWFRGGRGAQGVAGQGGGRGAAPPGAWPQQPPLRSPGGSGAPAPAGVPVYPPRSRRRRLRPWRVFGVLVLLVVLLVVAAGGTYFWLNGKLNRSPVLTDYSGRPVAGAGTNWLIAGSDSRQGLTRAQELQYAVGKDAGSERSDTILILHIPANGGQPVLVSIPRDSYVAIPGHGKNKINAAFAFGGPALLAQTIQNATGLYISHYMEIGFGGFVNVVNDVGGVRMCLDAPLVDKASGVNLQKGCQVLNGGQALAFVRDRHSFATQDLQREQDQRLFLSALLTKLTSPGVMYNPFVSVPAASGVASNLTVDEGTSLYQLVGVANALRDPLTTTVPIADSNYPTSAGDAVLWSSSRSKALFTDLYYDRTVPKSLISGSKLPS